ncbi:hypothetical protein GCM10020331_092860 [Ectobacillus funiculus]
MDKKNPAYPIAVEELGKEKNMPSGMQLRQKKYLNNIVEQDHRFYQEAGSLYVRIEIISYSHLHTEWHRSDAYD